MEKGTVDVSVWLDTRRKKANGKYPVKVKVYHRPSTERKYYPTEFEFSEDEFNSIWNSNKPRSEVKQIKLALQEVEAKAYHTANAIEPFNFETFEKRLFIGAKDATDAFFHYASTIEDLKAEGRLGNASNYNLSMKSIKAFMKMEIGREPKKLNFNDITVAWLNRYEKFMLKQGKSYTTIGIYLRHLRAIFNKAIEEKDIEQSIYPFGKRRYQIPAGKGEKKAFSKDELSLLYHAEALTPEQQKAKDFFFFSYSCNGMNVKDIAQLRYSDIEEDKLSFYRAKTINTAKGNLRKVEVCLTDKPKAIIQQYGQKNTHSGQLVFDIINDWMTEEQKRSSIQAFTRFINQHLKKLAVHAGLNGDVSTYWARHSFATNAIRSGASMEFVSEALSHSSPKTTQAYFAGFSDDDKRKMAEILTDF